MKSYVQFILKPFQYYTDEWYLELTGKLQMKHCQKTKTLQESWVIAGLLFCDNQAAHDMLLYIKSITLNSEIKPSAALGMKWSSHQSFFPLCPEAVAQRMAWAFKFLYVVKDLHQDSHNFGRS